MRIDHDLTRRKGTTLNDYGRKTEKTVNVNESSYAAIAANMDPQLRSCGFLSLLEIYLTSRLKIALLNNGTVYKQNHILMMFLH